MFNIMSGSITFVLIDIQMYESCAICTLVNSHAYFYYTRLVFFCWCPVLSINSKDKPLRLQLFLFFFKSIYRPKTNSSVFSCVAYILFQNGRCSLLKWWNVCVNICRYRTFLLIDYMDIRLLGGNDFDFFNR